MKFIHLSDTHLGYQHLGLEERKRDFFDAFNYVVEYALQENVDFIIHTGDFFHTSRPSNETLLEGITLLKKLKEKRIPIYTISGNHDRGSGTRDKSPLEILKELGLRIVDNSFEAFEDINIFGLRHIHTVNLRKIDLNSVLQELYEKADKRPFNILMLHLEFQPIFPSGINFESSIPECFNYVGIGHYHQKQDPFKFKDSLIVYPGSTEYTQFNEKDYSEKGFYLIEIENQNNIEYKFIPIPTRKFLTYRFKDEDLEAVIDSIGKINFSDNKKPILILKGITEKNFSKKDIINLIEERGFKDNFLHISINIEKVENEYEFTFIGNDSEKSRIEIEKILSEDIDEENLRSKVLTVINAINSFENMQELENYINENPELFTV
ncbi:MAG: exonuclease SbcCD subunit D [Hydrogenothermaceae bacterium]|nr:exonuclease SbcCD subunit D [Hydrogenothermaceae bacterium]